MIQWAPADRGSALKSVSAERPQKTMASGHLTRLADSCDRVRNFLEHPRKV
jgi:hypothetical protein